MADDCTSRRLIRVGALSALTVWSGICAAGEAPSPATSSAPAVSPAPTSQPAATQPAINPFELRHLERLTAGKEPAETLFEHAQTLIEVSQDPRVKAELALLLAKSPVLATRVTICRALAAQAVTDDQFVEPLFACLAAEDATLRQAAASALRRYRTHGVPQRLGEVAGTDTLSIDHRRAALETLGGINHPDAITALLELLVSESAVIRALAILQDKTAQSFGGDPAAWQTWWQTHGDTWVYDKLDRQDEALARSRKARQEVGARLVGALEDLYKMKSPAQRASLHLTWFKDADPSVRHLAIEILRTQIHEHTQTGGPIADALRVLIEDPAPDVRRQAAALIPSLDRQVDDPKRLVRQLVVETNVEAIIAIVLALGQIPDPEAIPALVARIDDTRPAVVIAAAKALGSLGSKGASTTEAVKKLSTGVLKRRFAAAVGNDPPVALVLLDAMSAIGDSSFVPSFESSINDPALREAAIKGLGLADHGDPNHLALVKAHLQDNSPAVQSAAAEAVGRLGQGRADFEALVGLLGEEKQVSDAAKGSIERIAHRLPVDDLIDAANPLREAAPDLYVALMTRAEQDLAKRQPRSRRLAEVRERLGDVRSHRGQHAEAEKLYGRAHQQHVEAERLTRAAGLAQKRVGSLLRIDRFADAMTFAGKTAGNPNAKTAEGMAKVVLQFARECMAAEPPQPKRVISLCAQIHVHLLGKLNDADKAKVEAARATAIAVLVEALARGPLTGNDAARKAAEAEIQALGDAAIPPLARELDRILAAKPPKLDAEPALLALLKVLADDWPGYDSKAPVDLKREKLKPLLAD